MHNSLSLERQEAVSPGEFVATHLRNAIRPTDAILTLSTLERMVIHCMPEIGAERCGSGKPPDGASTGNVVLDRRSSEAAWLGEVM